MLSSDPMYQRDFVFETSGEVYCAFNYAISYNVTVGYFYASAQQQFLQDLPHSRGRLLCTCPSRAIRTNSMSPFPFPILVVKT
jgi:hypothetical protein